MNSTQKKRQRLNIEVINIRLVGRGIVMLDAYTRQTEKKRFQCSQGHVWAAQPNNVLSGKGCPTCGKISASKKMRLSEETVRHRLASREITLLGQYINSQTKAQFLCNEGHLWNTTPNSVMGGRGCPHCYEKNQPLTKEIINARIADREIILLGDYLGAHASTLFQCSEGHTWQARPNNILQGKNCPHCDGQFPLTKEIVNARIADRGLILIGDYVNSVTKATFQCNEGHTWEVPPGNVMAGTGCAACGGHLPLTTAIVNERIANRGLVLLDPYVNNWTKRRFKCSEAHVWETAPQNVLAGRGCTDCADWTSDNDVFYLWVAGPQQHVRLRHDEFLLKYGVTSEYRKDLRMKEIGWAWGTKPNVLAVIKTTGSAILAEKAAARIGRCLTPEYEHMDGWTEFRIVNEDELAQLVSIAERVANFKIHWNVQTFKETQIDSSMRYITA